MLVNTKSIVLRTVNYSETSVVCTMYTQELGLQAYMVNGVRTSAKGNKAMFFRPGTLLDLVAYNRQDKNLQRLKEYKISHLYQSVPFDVTKSSLALFLIEVLNKVLKEAEPNEALFEFVERAFIQLDTDEANYNFHLQFLIFLTSHLGFFPLGKHCTETPFLNLQEGHFQETEPEHAYFISGENADLLSTMIANEPLNLSRSQRQFLLGKLILYYQLHIEGFGEVKSYKILQEIFS